HGLAVSTRVRRGSNRRGRQRGLTRSVMGPAVAAAVWLSASVIPSLSWPVPRQGGRWAQVSQNARNVTPGGGWLTHATFRIGQTGVIVNGAQPIPSACHVNAQVRGSWPPASASRRIWSQLSTLKALLATGATMLAKNGGFGTTVTMTLVEPGVPRGPITVKVRVRGPVPWNMALTVQPDGGTLSLIPGLDQWPFCGWNWQMPRPRSRPESVTSVSSKICAFEVGWSITTLGGDSTTFTAKLTEVVPPSLSSAV